MAFRVRKLLGTFEKRAPGTKLNVTLRRRFDYLFWRPRRRQTGRDYTGSRAFQLTDQQDTCQSPGHLGTHGGWVQLLRPPGGSTKKITINNKTFLGLYTKRQGVRRQLVNIHCKMSARKFLSRLSLLARTQCI